MPLIGRRAAKESAIAMVSRQSGLAAVSDDTDRASGSAELVDGMTVDLDGKERR
jgi:hypothetical protein